MQKYITDTIIFFSNFLATIVKPRSIRFSGNQTYITERSVANKLSYSECTALTSTTCISEEWL